MKNIAVFASGEGTNVQRISEYFNSGKNIRVSVVFSNRSKAKVLERAAKLSVESIVITRNDFYETDNVLRMLVSRKIDLIVLAGFLWLVPEYLIKHYSCKIINIHPALLPLHGGKGMYGMKVHEAVWANRETETGITIHYVNEQFDEGRIIFQAKCEVHENDTPEIIASKVHELEYRHFPEVIEKLLQNKV